MQRAAWKNATTSEGGTDLSDAIQQAIDHDRFECRKWTQQQNCAAATTR